MTQQSSSNAPVEWNFFAVELRTLLTARGLTMWSLQSRVGIHKEKIRRLNNSLSSNKHLAVLNPTEVQLIEQTLVLTATERNRLMAALITTQIEMVLLSRMQSTIAYQAAARFFPVLLEAVEQDARQRGILSQLESVPLMEDTALIDIALASIFFFVDRANSALFTSHQTTSLLEAVASVEEAINDLHHAQERFAALSPHITSSDICQYWQQEVNEQLGLAQHQLAILNDPDE